MAYSCGTRILIDNTRLSYIPPTTTRMANDVIAKQVVLFSISQSFLGFLNRRVIARQRIKAKLKFFESIQLSPSCPWTIQLDPLH